MTDPIGLIADLIAVADHCLEPEAIRTVVAAVAGGRAKSRLLAVALAERPAVLTDGRSPAPRGLGNLLIALREAGATGISPPVCTECGKDLRTLQRRGQNWYCGVCGPKQEPCTACGKTRKISTRDRSGGTRCAKCPDVDGRDPLTVIHNLVTALDPLAGKNVVADAVRGASPRLADQRRMARALEADPSLLTGKGHLAPVPAILRLIDLLHAAAVDGIVRPACPRCHRTVRIGKPLDGQRVCRNCIAKSRIEECARCGTRREPATRDSQGRPMCPNCLIQDPANLETCTVCSRRRSVSVRTSNGPVCPSCRPLPTLVCSICGRTAPCALSQLTEQPRCGACHQRQARCSICGSFRGIHSGSAEAPVCGPCTKPDVELWRPCPTCGQADRLRAPGPCRRCLLNHRLGELLTGPSGVVAPELQALHDALAGTERAATALHWLS
ncbi:site-specific integrase, partial [Streptomyces sp. BE133]|nr:site-specific integrase [Streptomyces sp. BE133]